MEDPKLKELAAKYNRSVAQILLRYQVNDCVFFHPVAYDNRNFLNKYFQKDSARNRCHSQISYARAHHPKLALHRL